MKDTLQRILFYLRYEMTEDVRTWIELSVLSGLILLFLGFHTFSTLCLSGNS